MVTSSSAHVLPYSPPPPKYLPFNPIIRFASNSPPHFFKLFNLENVNLICSYPQHKKNSLVLLINGIGMRNPELCNFYFGIKSRTWCLVSTRSDSHVLTAFFRFWGSFMVGPTSSFTIWKALEAVVVSMSYTRQCMSAAYSVVEGS